MTKSRFERNWERAGHFLTDVGARFAPIAGSLASRGSLATAAAGAGIGAGIDAVAQRVRQVSDPGRMRPIARKLEKGADYLRYRASSDIARDAWHTVNRKPVWVAAGSALGAWITYRLLSRD